MTRAELFERDADLAALHAAALDAERGSGGLVLVEAPAGAGKTSLVAAAVAASPLPSLQARGAELERDFAFGGMRQLLAPALDGELEGEAAPARALHDPDASVAPGLGVLRAILWLVTSLAPVLLIVDDLHWVDEASLRALDFIARRSADLPILVVAAMRPAEPGAPLEVLDAIRESATTVVTPRPLSAAAVADIVRADTPGASDAVCDAAHAASAGNPLYLREILRTAELTETGIAAATVPTLGDRVVRRAARVDDQAPALTAAMAVLGDGTPLARAATIAGVPAAAAGGIAKRLQRADILAADDPIAFVHPVVRASLYEGLSAYERSRLHTAAADAVDGDHDAVAAHLGALTPAANDAVAGRLLAAARDAMGRAAPEAAIVRLRRAVGEGAADPTPAELLFELGKAEMAIRAPAAAGHLEEAYAAATDPELRLAIVVILTDLLSAIGDWDRLAELIDAEWRPEPQGAARLELEAVRTAIRVNDARFAAGLAADWEDLERLGQDPSWGGHAVSEALVFGAALRGDRETALRCAHQALADGVLLNERPAGGWAGPQLMFALIGLDEVNLAFEIGRQIGEDGRRNGVILGELAEASAGIFVAGRAGDLVGVETAIKGGRTIADVAGMQMWAANVAWFAVPAIVERPSVAAVFEGLDRVPLVGAFARTTAAAMLLEARGTIRAAQDNAAGITDLREAGEIFDILGAMPAFTAWRSRLARALPRGARDEAVALAETDLALASTPRARGVALRTLGALTGDRGRLTQAIAELRATNARYELADALVVLGGAQRRANELIAARETLREGVDLAHACGAQRLHARAEEELRSAGARRRQARPASGLESLTERERRVAQLAAAGRSSPEIAHELFVSVKTVETHLSRVYAKLGIAGHGARMRLGERLTHEAQAPREAPLESSG